MLPNAYNNYYQIVQGPGYRRSRFREGNVGADPAIIECLTAIDRVSDENEWATARRAERGEGNLFVVKAELTIQPFPRDHFGKTLDQKPGRVQITARPDMVAIQTQSFPISLFWAADLLPDTAHGAGDDAVDRNEIASLRKRSPIFPRVGLTITPCFFHRCTCLQVNPPGNWEHAEDMHSTESARRKPAAWNAKGRDPVLKKSRWLLLKLSENLGDAFPRTLSEAEGGAHTLEYLTEL
jgi:hypothetical protein